MEFSIRRFDRRISLATFCSFALASLDLDYQRRSQPLQRGCFGVKVGVIPRILPAKMHQAAGWRANDPSWWPGLNGSRYHQPRQAVRWSAWLGAPIGQQHSNPAAT
jgi:hypothetical protein